MGISHGPDPVRMNSPVTAEGKLENEPHLHCNELLLVPLGGLLLAESFILSEAAVFAVLDLLMLYTDPFDVFLLACLHGLAPHSAVRLSVFILPCPSHSGRAAELALLVLFVYHCCLDT